ncbi:hypothetical protein PV11_02104 [Exophiala sideris]|uniref:Uncharacterized protein n=1 Tax=Exophiala sideris TaxID=1016849 RepID=A0A0D1ZI34_9EURO|nr:hypothetical protein PV11_02104 [Exophiala sideris]
MLVSSDKQHGLLCESENIAKVGSEIPRKRFCWGRRENELRVTLAAQMSSETARPLGWPHRLTGLGCSVRAATPVEEEKKARKTSGSSNGNLRATWFVAVLLKVHPCRSCT